MAITAKASGVEAREKADLLAVIEGRPHDCVQSRSQTVPKGNGTTNSSSRKGRDRERTHAPERQAADRAVVSGIQSAEATIWGAAASAARTSPAARRHATRILPGPAFHGDPEEAAMSRPSDRTKASPERNMRAQTRASDKRSAAGALRAPRQRPDEPGQERHARMNVRVEGIRERDAREHVRHGADPGPGGRNPKAPRRRNIPTRRAPSEGSGRASPPRGREPGTAGGAPDRGRPRSGSRGAGGPPRSPRSRRAAGRGRRNRGSPSPAGSGTIIGSRPAKLRRRTGGPTRRSPGEGGTGGRAEGRNE